VNFTKQLYYLVIVTKSLLMNFYSFFKMMQRKKYTVASPKNPKAVSFFNHFPSNFLRPYGLASEAPDSDAIIRRTNPKSCEWLLRPAIAMSEFAQTLVENMEFLKTTDSKFVRSKRMKEAVDNMQPFPTALDTLNTRSDSQPDPTAVTTVLTHLYDDDGATCQAMCEIFQVGGAMFLASIHFLVAQQTLGDPQTYADRLVDQSTEAKKFKRSRSLPALQKFLKDLCTNTGSKSPSTSSSGATTSRKSLLRQLQSLPTQEESSDDEEHQLPAKRSRMSASDHNESDDAEQTQGTFATAYRGKGKGKGKGKAKAAK
jgi:hypothetical protein